MVSFSFTVTILIFHLYVYGSLGGPIQSNYQQGIIFPAGSNCNDVWFREQTGGYTGNVHAGSAQYCRHIGNNNVPTTIYLNNNRACMYQVIGYSGLHCEDSSQTFIDTLHSRQSVTFNTNGRMRVCSFYLVYRPMGTVQVTFSGGGFGDKTFGTSDRLCYNICSGSRRDYYPEHVKLNDVGFGNGVMIFSDLGCTGENRMPSRDGSINSAGQTQSYRIVPRDT